MPKKDIILTLSKKEVDLLLLILEDAEQQRSDMGCNDPYEEEEKLFTKKERIEMQRRQLEFPDEVDEDDIDGFLFNNQYVQHIIDRVEEQIK